MGFFLCQEWQLFKKTILSRMKEWNQQYDEEMKRAPVLRITK